jgi:hypothetical protein
MEKELAESKERERKAGMDLDEAKKRAADHQETIHKHEVFAASSLLPTRTN